jgi:transcriptional regulator with XRE-family HTH domain
MLGSVTPQQVGRIARVLRHRQRLRQVDVAHRAGVSRLTVMKLEAGQAGGLTLNGIAAVFQGLGGRIDLRPMWQGAALDRLLDEGHARLSGRMLEILGREGWATELEVTFSVYGDRGSIDILAWHAASRTLLVVEIKTELGSVEGLLRPLDVKCRLARDIARDRFGWQPARVGRLVIMPEDSTVRRQVSRHARIVDVSLPHRSREVRQWLRSPHGQLAGLWFLSEVRSTNPTRSPSAVRRIRPATPRSPGPT